MTEQTDNAAGGSTLDWLWVTIALALVAAGLVGYYSLTAQPVWLRAITVLAGVGAGVGVFAISGLGRFVWQFALGSRVELRKMVWPSFDDSRKTTLIVFVFVVVLGIFFWGVDAFFAWATRHLLGTGA